MKVLFSIFFATVCLFVACEKQTDVLPEQQAKIASYLSGTHNPRLISEQQRATSQDVNPEYYTVAGDSVFRYIKHIYDTARLSQPEVAYGDRVSLTFRMYVFGDKNIVTTGTTIDLPFYSNDPLLLGISTEDGWKPAWNFEPLEIELGRTEIIKGLEVALPGCRQRDTVELFMSYNMAYGKKPFAVIPKESPIAIFFSVDEVIKQ